MEQSPDTNDAENAGNRVHERIKNGPLLPQTNQDRSVLNDHSAYGKQKEKES
jgi:hypothetical protein